MAYACAALFRSESGTRGRFCRPLRILVLGSVIVTQEDLHISSKRLKSRGTTPAVLTFPINVVVCIICGPETL